jgi:hypothetical protein
MGEEKNLVTAFQIHEGKVMTSDQQKLGIIVNIFIDPEMDFAARMLIFPEERPWWWDMFVKRGKEWSLDLIEQALPEETDKILKTVAEKGSDFALEFWTEYLKRRKCYFVSLLEISKIEQKKVILKIDKTGEHIVSLKSSLNQIKSGYGDLTTYENELAFFREDDLLKEENKTLLPITLNLPVFKTKKVYDQQGGKGYVFNILLDPKKGQVTNIIVQIPAGPDAGNHIISTMDFDWSTFEVKTNLATAPIYGSL